MEYLYDYQLFMFHQNLYPYGILSSVLGLQEVADGADQSRGCTGVGLTKQGQRMGLGQEEILMTKAESGIGRYPNNAHDSQAKDLEPLTAPFLCVSLAPWVNLKHCPNGHYITIIDILVHCLLKTIRIFFLRITLLNYSVL